MSTPSNREPVPLDRILDTINSIFVSSLPEIKLEDKEYPLFPFDKAYAGQNQAINALLEHDRVLLCSHTGSGKTAVYLTAALTTRQRSLVLVPRNFLQRQVEEYNELFKKLDGNEDRDWIRSLLGKSRYFCRFTEIITDEGRYLPCEARYYHPKFRSYVFEVGNKLYPYPCPDCEYERQKERVKDVYLHGGVIVLNQGNFHLAFNMRENKGEWLYPYFVIVDEADEFVKAITQGISVSSEERQLMVEMARKEGDSEIADILKTLDSDSVLAMNKNPELLERCISYFVEMLKLELEEINRRITKLEELLSEPDRIPALELPDLEEELGKEEPGSIMLKEKLKENLVRLRRKQESVSRKLGKAHFFMENLDKVFVYVRSETSHSSKLYFEMFTTEEETVLRLFRHARKLCIATATPFEVREFKQVSYEIPFRAKVIYAPVGKLTYWEVYRKGNTDLLRKAVEDYIIPIHDYVSALLGSKTKTPIHCGSLSRHGTFIADILKNNGKQVLLHKEGHLDETIKMFREKDYDFLCVVAAEYGADWYWCPLQFVVKVPYADASDPREQAIRKRFSEEEWKRRYDWDALSRLVQACGRNARKPEQFSVTVILDQKFEEVYARYYHLVPQWFKNRLIWLSSTPPPEPGA